jgi:hypothetical protein
MTTGILIPLAILVGLGIGGNAWLLAQEARGRSRTGRWNTRILRSLSVACAAVVAGTALFARPWYWDLALVAAAGMALLGVWRVLGWMWRRPGIGLGRAMLTSAGAMGLGIVLFVLGGVAAVLDGAALSSPTPLVTYHGGPVVAHPVLYQVFWGPQWARSGLPAERQAVAFQQAVGGSGWARAVASAGYGVHSFTSGGCWVDPSSVPSALTVTTTRRGPFPGEIGAVFSGAHRVSACPGAPRSTPLGGLGADAVVALWLPPSAQDELGGVAAHGTAPWPGLAAGVVVAGLPGAYAFWGTSSCSAHPSCGSLPGYASPSYALSHEVLEAATNPFGTGWFADAPLSWTARYVLAHGPLTLLGFGVHPGYPGEIADLCEPGERPTAGQPADGQPAAGRITTSSGVTVPVAPFYLPDGRCTVG